MGRSSCDEGVLWA